jgi:hypothetical protein
LRRYSFLSIGFCWIFSHLILIFYYRVLAEVMTRLRNRAQRVPEDRQTFSKLYRKLKRNEGEFLHIKAGDKVRQRGASPEMRFTERR